jgi:hypothetical protein
VSMVAYLFWHRPERIEGYEEALQTFHAHLRAALPALSGSASYHVGALPWLDGHQEGEQGYEDWYLLPDLGALADLNETAVSEAVREAHDRAALASAWGAGGVYATIHGDPSLDAPTVTWLTKPRDVRYPEFFASLPPTTCLLRRQLVLGPAPEFCAFGELPGGLVVQRRPVTFGAGAPAARPDRSRPD